MDCRFETLAEWLNWQESLHPQEIDLGLDRVRSVYQNLEINSIANKIITIAGTNGKGSSVAFLERLYLAAGYKVASYTSPHLLRYNERVRILGKPVSDAALIQGFHAVDQARVGQTLSFFEFGTLAAFYLFSQAELDVVLLEVGLGGRLDATNIIDADVSLITSIGLDHQAWLGTTRDAIAREKSGIARSGRPLICGDREPPEAIFDEAQKTGALLSCIGEGFDYCLTELNWSWRNQNSSYTQLPFPNPSTQAQLENITTALQAASQLQDELPFDGQALKQALLEYSLPGRCECMPGTPEVWLDVAHNEQAITVLVDALKERGIQPTHIVLGILDDKDASQIIKKLSSVCSRWYFAEPRCSRAMSCEKLMAAADSGIEAKASCYKNVLDAFDAAVQQASQSGRVVVTGSFYTVSEVMAEHYAKCL